ncbi:hypothetical protein LTR97_004616 [Elasticomyces elasticus]|uniref:RING-type domain-containing protein n=1 Tax=Elasticomyces elasticus TaxID=574655 RepID=A0AAN8A2G5_9PEZI|nr:hypothetical protein LTR97_004616 [Elasticomyces elasticus]
MSSYDIEHSVPAEQKDQPRRRPDLSTFFGNLDMIDTSQTQNANSIPLPRDISAAYRNLANAFDMMRGGTQEQGQNGLLEQLVESLMQGAEHPPTEVQGVSDEFIQELERVPKKSLKEDQSCPICSNPFLEDPHPLVVRLACHKDHLFDLECIQPWLKLNPTCPLDRQVLVKKKAPPPPPDEEEADYDEIKREVIALTCVERMQDAIVHVRNLERVSKRPSSDIDRLQGRVILAAGIADVPNFLTHEKGSPGTLILSAAETSMKWQPC